jgi:hypothetical protein
MSSWITPRQFICKADARLALRKSSPLGRSHKDGTSNPPEDAALMKQQPRFISAQLLEAPGGSSTLANYAVWESAERFAREFDTID